MALWLAILLASWGTGQSPVQWTIVQELRIGSVDDSIYALGPIGQLTVGPDGSVYVPQGQQFKVFDSNGVFIRTIGRSGEGPGEFRDMLYVSWCGDTLFATDQRLQRVVLFDAAGKLLETRPWTAPAVPQPLGRSVPVAVLTSGTVVFRPNHALLTGAEDLLPRQIPVLRADWSGNVLDTLARFPPPAALVFRRGNRFKVASQPFERTPILRIQPGGSRVFVVEFPESSDRRTEPVRVTVFDAKGRRLYSRTHAAPQTRIPRRAVDSVYAAAVQSLVQSGFMTLREAEKAVREQMTMPATYPPVTAGVAASDGSLWLGLRPRQDGSRIWWVLGQDGNIDGQIVTPPRVQVRAVQGSTVWAVERDELDVPYITKYRAVRGSSRGSRDPNES